MVDAVESQGRARTRALPGIWWGPPHEAAALSRGDARRYRLASAADVESRLTAGETRVVVYRLWNRFPPVPDWEGGLRRGGYRLIATVDTTKIYAR